MYTTERERVCVHACVFGNMHVHVCMSVWVRACMRACVHVVCAWKFSSSRAGKIRSPSRHLRPKNIFGDQITGHGGQFGD